MLARIKALHAAIVLTGLAGGLLVSSSALGLALGEIVLSSALNEPLNAVIELEDLEGLDASEIMIAIGDQQAYDQVDMERAPFLDDIAFTVEVDSESQGRILLTSTENLTEPLLNLIITAREPAGAATLKEYTLLVELSNATRAPVQVAPAVAGNTAVPVDAVTVGPGQTLWEIAANKRPDAGISVQQMMVAIQRANPDAFIGGNINRLISGRVLRMPSARDVDVVDRDSALAQVAQQNTDLGGQPLVAGNSGGGPAAADQRDQLSVLSGDNTGPAAGGDLAATIASLENELMLSEESLDRARIENLELNNRLSALQEQIDLLENIIAMEDDRIAGLQAELAAQADATAQALTSADTAAAALNDINSQPASTVTGTLRNTALAIGAVLLLALLVLGFLVQRRKQAQLAAEESTYNPALDDDDTRPDLDANPGLLAGLLARFRRKPDADNDDDDDYELDIVTSSRIEPVAVAPQPKKNSTDSLLDEMGITEEISTLHAALDGIDSTQRDQAPADVFEALKDDDYAMAAATEAFASFDNDIVEPEVTEFRTTLIDAPVNVPEQVVEVDTAETFEFTLNDLPEVAEIETFAPAAVANEEKIETFEFKLSRPVVEQPAVVPAVSANDDLEVVAFPSKALSANDSSDDDLLLGLGDLRFDDTMLADDDEEESPYRPRTGNECDTKLDLATAYEAMGDVNEAIEILDEVIAEGTPAQIETAQRLKQSWQSA